MKLCLPSEAGLDEAYQACNLHHLNRKGNNIQEKASISFFCCDTCKTKKRKMKLQKQACFR